MTATVRSMESADLLSDCSCYPEAYMNGKQPSLSILLPRGSLTHRTFKSHGGDGDCSMIARSGLDPWTSTRLPSMPIKESFPNSKNRCPFRAGNDWPSSAYFLFHEQRKHQRECVLQWLNNNRFTLKDSEGGTLKANWLKICQCCLYFFSTFSCTFFVV